MWCSFLLVMATNWWNHEILHLFSFWRRIDSLAEFGYCVIYGISPARDTPSGLIMNLAATLVSSMSSTVVRNLKHTDTLFANVQIWIGQHWPRHCFVVSENVFVSVSDISDGSGVSTTDWLWLKPPSFTYTHTKTDMCGRHRICTVFRHKMSWTVSMCRDRNVFLYSR